MTDSNSVNPSSFQPTTNGKQIGLLLGPAVSLLMVFLGAPEGLSVSAWYTAACMVLMAVWWITEAVPVSVTALLPIILFPLLGIADIKTTTASYSHPIVYLFLGGFFVALAIERWSLHKRISLFILSKSNGDARLLMGAFMLAAAFLSMWISNTATTIMLLPMGLAITGMIRETLRDVTPKEKENFQTALVLSIAYAATIGGVSTLIGTPPNALMAAFVAENYGIEIGFLQWMSVGLPATLLMLPITWLMLTRVILPFDFKISSQAEITISAMREDLGQLSNEERRVAIVFFLMASGWVLRPFIDDYALFSGLSDSGVAILAATSLFLLPQSQAGKRLLDWEDASKLPWGILILFGGGLSLAAAIKSTGLGYAIGSVVSDLPITSMLFLVLSVTVLIVFLTEITSNLATTATFLPIIGAIALEMGIDPLVLIVPVALSASCAFMFPVATPPNAIIYSSGYLTIAQMSRVGFSLNILAILVVTFLSAVLVPLVFIHA